MGLKDRIKEFDDCKKETMTIPQWNDEVIEIRSFMGWTRSRLLDKARQEDGELDNIKLNELLLVESCYDPETGEKLFDESDLDWLREKSGPAIDDIVSKIISINKLSQESIDEEAKN